MRCGCGGVCDSNSEHVFMSRALNGTRQVFLYHAMCTLHRSILFWCSAMLQPTAPIQQLERKEVCLCAKMGGE